MRTYLYGIMASQREADLGLVGIDGASPVYTVVHEGIAGVVSDYQGEEFRILSKQELVRRLLTHQQVVERVMQQHTVLPVKFGTLLNKSQEVLALLSQRHSDFVEALASIQDKVEIEVAATWDTSRVLQEVSKEEAVVGAIEAITRGGQSTVEERIQVGQVVKACMDRRRESYRERMVSFLKPLSLAVAPNTLVSDQMVMNVAFMVDRRRLNEFDEAVQQLDEIFRNEIKFRMIGPLPPYSFSTVEITRLTPEQVNEAWQALHLGDSISQADVRRAYRRLAAEEQRNLRAGHDLAGGRFARLRRACELLLEYCRAQPKARTGAPASSPVNRDSGCTFLMTLRRSRGDEVEPARFGKLESMWPGR